MAAGPRSTAARPAAHRAVQQENIALCCCDWCTARTFGGSAVEEIAGILAIIFVLGVPSMALATHLVVRPLIREYGKLRGLKEDKDQIEARMTQLEDIVHDLDRQVNRLLEAEQFRRELESGGRRELPGP